MRRAIVGLMIVGALSLFATGTAAAYQLQHYSVSSSFDGTGSDANIFGDQLRGIAVDEQSGNVYALTSQSGVVVDKFDAAGTPAAFSAPSLNGENSLNLGVSSVQARGITVDNSASATQGRIYVVVQRSSPNDDTYELHAFNPDGSAVGGNYPLVLNLVADVVVDPTSGDLWLAKKGSGATGPRRAMRYTSAGVPSSDSFPVAGNVVIADDAPVRFAIDGGGNVYDNVGGGLTYKYSSAGALQYSIASSGLSGLNDLAVNTADGTLWDADPMNVTQYTLSGTRVAQYDSPSGGSASIAVNGETGTVYVGSADASPTYPGAKPDRIDILIPGATVTVPDVATGDASDFHPTDVTLHGTIDPDNVDTNDCHFEWSTDLSFANSTACTGGNVLSGSGEQQVEAHVTGLIRGTTYNYRLVASNANAAPTGEVVGRQDKTFVPSSPPTFAADQYVDDVSSTGFTAHFAINPGGAPTAFHVEYGPADCSTIICTSSADGDAGSGTTGSPRSLVVSGLAPDTTYHYRVVAENQSDTTYGPDGTFTTFPDEDGSDTCANSHVRQQVSAAFLPDCRAYELVSATNTGGYDVESDLVAGQDPFGGYPQANEKALYGIHNGAVPGPWNPTNHGIDPYVATRGPHGWSTNYVGIPADNPNAAAPFSSSLLGADPGLDTFAFGGAGICDPCFADGSSGIPLRMPDGNLVQGMTGATPDPSAAPAGIIRKHFSEDGAHLLFGTTAQLESTANSNGTDATIYERDLSLGSTQVVSTDETGTAIANGQGVAELDVSKTGDRVVIGKLISTDAKGNSYYHLYVHLTGKPDSIDLTPGTSSGALYAGMTTDGSMVYFTTTDALTSVNGPQDSDTSVDLYRADIDQNGALTITRVSTTSSSTTGGLGDTNGCDPVANTINSHWNLVSGAGDCSVVAIGGGGGVAADQGTVYFLSPEVLDSSGSTQPVQNAPNLYEASPGGDPHFMATLESQLTAPFQAPTSHTLSGSFTSASFVNAQQMAVDQSTGDIYLFAVGAGQKNVQRFHPDGTPSNFVAGPNAGTNKLTGFIANNQGAAQVAIDNSGGPTDGNIYVTNNSTASQIVKIYARDGTFLGQLNGSATPEGEFGAGGGSFSKFPTGVAVDPNGKVYISGGFSRKVYRYDPSKTNNTDGTHYFPVEADYDQSLNIEGSLMPMGLAADSNGNLYVELGTEFAILEPGLVKFSAAQFGLSGPQAGVIFDPNSKAAYVDPLSDYVYTNDRSRIQEYLPNGTLHDTFGSTELEVNGNSRGVAVFGSASGGSTKIFAIDTTAKTVFVYDSSFTPEVAPKINSPLVVHSVNDSASRYPGDFQATGTGQYAAFSATLPLTYYDSNRLPEVYRYDTQGNTLECSSCNPTGARAIGGSSLALNGLSILDDGTLFFNSGDALAARDLDNRQDVYKWDGGATELISTGTSPFDSSLLGISADGTDVFFFTKDILVPEDENGNLVKLYDARAGGGFEFVPETPPCKASDECHGAGSPTPAPAAINSLTGTRGNAPQEKAAEHRCGRGKRKVRRKGKVRCVRVHKRRHARANANRGGVK